MKSFNITVRLHGVTQGYTSHNVRRIFLRALGRTSLAESDAYIFVEEIRPLPDLSADESLSEEDISYLHDLQEALAAQVEVYSGAIEAIHRRLAGMRPKEIRPVWGVLSLPGADDNEEEEEPR